MGFVFLNNKMILGAAAAIMAAFGIGILIGYFAIGGPASQVSNEEAESFRDAKSLYRAGSDFNEEQKMLEEVMANIKGDEIRDYLHTLTAEPHIADKKRDLFLIGKTKEYPQDSTVFKYF